MIIPAIDLIQGKTVRLYQGSYDKTTEYQQTPLQLRDLYAEAGAGILHFVLLDFFASIVPPYLTNPDALVQVSGVFEILGGIGILVQRTRTWAAYGLIALCIAVLPANIHMAMNPDQFAEIPVVLLYLRLPLQALIIWFIWRTTRVSAP